MSEQEPTPAARPAPQARPPAAETRWRRRLVAGGVALAALVVLGLIGASFLPRWWAQRVGDQAQGSIAAGILLGLFYGFVFTLVPLALLGAAALRRLRSWRLWLALLGLGALLAAPNLLTLGIVLGGGNAAHAGDRILDVEAPGFRGASLAGAIAAVVLLGFVGYLVASRRRARGRLRALQERAQRAAGTPSSPTDPGG
jgi:MFS family permease